MTLWHNVHKLYPLSWSHSTSTEEIASRVVGGQDNISSSLNTPWEPADWAKSNSCRFKGFSWESFNFKTPTVLVKVISQTSTFKGIEWVCIENIHYTNRYKMTNFIYKNVDKVLPVLLVVQRPVYGIPDRYGGTMVMLLVGRLQPTWGQ